MNKLILAGILLAAAPAFTQDMARRPGVGGTVAQGQSGATGNAPSVLASRGATGADTLTIAAATGGNAGRPSRVVPQGGASGGKSR